MSIKDKVGMALITSICLSMPSALWAAGSGAYRLEVPDAGAGGMGSAFVAQADTPAAVYYNPAGMTQIEGAELSVGTALIVPRNKHVSPSGNETKMQPNEFFIPHSYLVTDLGTERFAFGAGVLSEWGLGTHWRDESFSKYVATKSDLANMDVLIAGAYQINEDLSIGIGFNYDNSHVNKKRRFDVDTLNTSLGVPTSGATDANYQLKGSDKFAGGYILSVYYQPYPEHSFGLIYRSAIRLEFEGTLSVEGLSGVSSVVFGTNYSTRIKSKSTLPRSIVAGYAYRPSDRWVFEFDIEWMDWSAVEEEKVDYPNETSATRLAVLNDGNPVARDWEDAWSFAFGTEYTATEKLRLRAGYYYHQTPIPEIHFESLLPDADAHGITAGIGYRFKDTMLLDLAYHALIFEDRDIDNAKGLANGASIDGTYKGFTSVYLATLTYDF